jgi:serine/threonine protein kinase
MDEEALFYHALELPVEQRPPFLDEACGNDERMRRRVGARLLAHERLDSFLERPPVPAATSGPSLFSALADGDPKSDTPPAPQRPGIVIGPYRLIEKLGEGGMGHVFLAEQTEPVRRNVAIKIIKPGMDSARVIAASRPNGRRSRSWRIRTSRGSTRPAPPIKGSRTSSWSGSRASRSPTTATRDA